MCSALVITRIRDVAGAEERVANLEDISPSGACLHMETAAPVGADVEIVCAGCRLRGKVRYCRYVAIGYDVGVQFDERGTWSRERFEPEHLLVLPRG
jgi:hypothetical protein